MKNIIIFSVILLLFVHDDAHSSPYQTKPPKNPTQKELETMMKEAQKEFEGLSEEDKKEMEKLGVKIPDLKTLPKTGDKKDAFIDDDNLIPTKNTKLIEALPKKIFSTAELSTYIKTTTQSIAEIIKPDAKEMADKVIVLFKNDKHYGALLASAANGMWIMGYKEPAVYLMGRATDALPNADNYNNFAAYLTMSGAAHKAIPILEKLNAVHKNNTTILNNLGQAWLQLGDVNKAEKYFDSTILIYAYHPQANYSKAVIKEKQGKKPDAIIALKRSLKHSVTPSKLQKLKELEKENFKHPGYHIPIVYYSASFNLGLYTALIPQEYAKSGGMEVEKRWIDFREQIAEEKERLTKVRQALESKIELENQKLEAKAKKQRGVIFPPYYLHALNRYKNQTEGKEYYYKRLGQEGEAYILEWARLKTLFSNELKAEEEKSKNDEKESCEAKDAIIRKYISELNELNKKQNNSKVRELLTNSYKMYNHGTTIALTDATALAAVIDLKVDFLDGLYQLKHDFFALPECISSKNEKPFKKTDLPDYDVVNCQILNSFYFPGLGGAVMRCNNMTMEINSFLLPAKGSLTANFDGYVEHASVGASIKAIDIEVGATFDKDGNFVKGNGSISTSVKGAKLSANGEFDPNGFTKGSVELGIDVPMDHLPKGLEMAAPVQINFKNEQGAAMELGKEGISDFYVKDNTQGDFASSIESAKNADPNQGKISSTGEISNPENYQVPTPKSPQVAISADNRIGINSGISSPTGFLSGIK